MTDQELAQLNREGLIPGPGETEEAFSERVAESKKNYVVGGWIPGGHWHWAKEHLRGLFDLGCEWVPVVYSRKGLSPWEGAAVWIEGRRVVRVQLKKKELHRRDEILAHEAVHVARCAFEESWCEEFLAHMTSEKKWRRVLGPIVQRPWEVWPLLAGLVFPWLGIAWVSLGFGRLIWRHRILAKAAKNIQALVSDEKRTRAVLVRLTGEEIVRFSRGENILQYAYAQDTPRWKVIRLSYFEKTFS